MAEENTLTVTLVHSPRARQVEEWTLQLTCGCTVADAIAASPLREQWEAGTIERLAVGIWGRQATRSQALADHDRVEVYRELKIDPKTARRERFKKQGSRSAGLFARKS